jgi:uncharacterized protein YcbK (DUF882 family)
MRLSPHFTTSEFDCRDGTEVPRHAYDQLHRLCARYLEPLRARYGPVRVISGYRTRRWNSAVGGAPASYHVYLKHRTGVAADVTCARGTPAEWHRALEALNPGGLGLYTGHVHVDNRLGRARW